MTTITASDQAILDALDFEVSELESFIAPGFWSGFAIAAGVLGTAAAGFGVGFAIGSIAVT